MKKISGICLLASFLSGCMTTGQYYAKPGMTPVSLSQDSARCRLFARGASTSPFYAEGDGRFVAAAAIGHGIGTAIKQDKNFEECMEINGYMKQVAAQ